jgi:hypothetical protein
VAGGEALTAAAAGREHVLIAVMHCGGAAPALAACALGLDASVFVAEPRRPLGTRNSSVDRTGVDVCSSMQCGSELGEDVVFDDSGQRR